MNNTSGDDDSIRIRVGGKLESSDFGIVFSHRDWSLRISIKLNKGNHRPHIPNFKRLSIAVKHQSILSIELPSKYTSEITFACLISFSNPENVRIGTVGEARE